MNQAYDYAGDCCINPVINRNTWNSDYPLGGNYWSDYIGIAVDEKSGADQNEPNSDGIGDVPYNLYEVIPYNSGADKYPLMSPYNPLSPDFSPDEGDAPPQA